MTDETTPATGDKAPDDPIIWVREPQMDSWHIFDGYTVSRVPGANVLCPVTEVHWPEYRADLGAEKSCELCMRIYMQRKDL